MKSSLLVLSLFATTAAFGQVNQFLATTNLAWGVGDNLPAPYTQGDMTVSIEARIFGVWVPFTQNVGVDETLITKASGSANFSIALASINPLFAGTDQINFTGVVAGQQVTWTANQTFSQPGGYPISTSFMNGTQTVPVNVVVNNLATTGSLRSLFAAISALNIATLGTLSEVRGTYTGGDTVNFIDIVAGTASGTINNLPITGLRLKFRDIRHIMHVPLDLRIAGTITRLDSLPAEGTASLTLLPLSGSTPVASTTATIAPSGAYAWQLSGVPSGQYRLRVDTGSHVARTQVVNLAGSVPTVANASLPNGDVDNSGEVDAADIDATIAAFGGSGYGPTVFPDVDRSGEVDAADIDIVIANFGQTDN